MSSIVEILHVGDRGKLTNLKNTGTIFFHQCPFEKMPLLYFDYVKTADFGSEKKFSITIFHVKKIAIFCGTFYFAPKALKQSI